MKGPISVRKKYVGRAIRRSEDSGILRGDGGFLADIDLAGALEIHFVRSTQAHATIDRIHLDEASASPGVAFAKSSMTMQSSAAARAPASATNSTAARRRVTT